MLKQFFSKFFLILFLAIGPGNLIGLKAQSFEISPGNKILFLDGQFFSYFGENEKLSLLNRSWAEKPYERRPRLHIGNLLNYSFIDGFGLTIVGNMSNVEQSTKIGLHYIKDSPNFQLFIVPTYDFGGFYSLFSIVRANVSVGKDVLIYLGFEINTQMSEDVHSYGYQRLRFGITKNGYSFGPSANYWQSGSRLEYKELNLGVFIRKEFSL